MEYDGMSFIFDVDGTLCPIKKKEEAYEDLIPYEEMVAKLREYQEGGAKIILFTSRNMNSYKGNIGLINANTAKIMTAWLDKMYVTIREDDLDLKYSSVPSIEGELPDEIGDVDPF